MSFGFLLASFTAGQIQALTVIRIIVLVIAAIASLGVVLCVLFKPSNPEGGNNAITGKNDSYYAKNKGSTWEGRLNKLIWILAAVVLVMAIVFFAIEKVLSSAF